MLAQFRVLGNLSTKALPLLFLVVMFSVAVIRHELHELDRGLAQFEEHQPLAWSERLNVSLILLLSHAFQTVAFVVLVFGFFLVFGKLAVSPEVIESWVGNPPTDGSLFGGKVPFSDQLIQISFFLAVFSGLSFTVSNATTPSYRAAFFDPLLEEITESLDFRDAYLARWPESAGGQ